MSIHFPNQVLGYHGCDRELGEQLLAGKEKLRPSNRPYDWLGHGIYFWENNASRALHFAQEEHDRNPQKIRKPFVVGAIISLGNCFNLLEHENLVLLKEAFNYLKMMRETNQMKLEENKRLPGKADVILRNLDRAVVESAHELISLRKRPPFDSVRGMFSEGDELYPKAGFRDKNHIQLAILNPENIIGYFRVGDMGE